MTVDSVYQPEVKARDEDTEFSFEIESIGDEAMRVYVIDENGNRFRLQFGYPT